MVFNVGSLRASNGSEDAGDDTPTSNAAEGGASDLTGEELVLGYPTMEDPVVDGESIVAEPGAVTALVGPNGSGKSTLLKGLAKQLDPDDGSVLLDGRDVHSMGTKELARKLGLLSQESTSPDSITVEDLVYHGRYPHRGFFEHVTEEDQQAVDRAIELAGCDHLRDREVGSLSGGQKQLAWVAMVLAQDTDVLLLDEPTTFLDLHHQLEVMEIIETLRADSDITVVVVLHDIEQAARLADRVVALKDGEIQARGSPEEVVTEELLAEVFRVDAEVVPTDRGPRVTPLRARHDDENDADAVEAENSTEGETRR
ncbi:ATP-binding cassette domain-containing protein [Natronomonas sp. CBA1123]|uniref:ABC transporter ATP-binding protein n=1 Tax=Natronomonas sp. CBA1123 TaxID=2668070 RepID=UPI0012E9A772|nr:ABC transporter ATP-binding protein [Natronomonas sp. CBA1123]MUV85070.1 ATP-binding cassette domain-containing protein [Natronomonas sp. CBA1123]